MKWDKERLQEVFLIVLTVVVFAVGLAWHQQQHLDGQSPNNNTPVSESVVPQIDNGIKGVAADYNK